MKIQIDIDEKEIKEAVIKSIAQAIWHGELYEFKKAMEESMKTIDQAQISRLVTRVLVSEHIEQMRKNEI